MSQRIKCFFCEYTGKMTEPDDAGISRRIYRSDSIDGEFVLHLGTALAVGAIFYDEHGCGGREEKCLVVVTPGGLWYVNCRASNCTMPDDDIHRCWCIHGDPPNITVDKNCNTCKAGAGSILIGSEPQYHGYLRDGYLVSA